LIQFYELIEAHCDIQKPRDQNSIKMVDGRYVEKYCFDHNLAADCLICVKFCPKTQSDQNNNKMNKISKFKKIMMPDGHHFDKKAVLSQR